MEGHCDFFDDCAFLSEQMGDMPTMAQIFHSNYCAGDHVLCARRMILANLGASGVPADLFPNDRARALDILGGSGISL